MSTEYLANRYGKKPNQARRQRILWTTVVIALIAIFFTWSIMVNFSRPAKLTGTVQNFTVTSELQTKVTLNVLNATQQDGLCAIQVLNKGFAVVGYKEVAISGRLGKSPTIDLAVNTTDLGVSASVDHCWFK